MIFYFLGKMIVCVVLFLMRPHEPKPYINPVGKFGKNCIQMGGICSAWRTYRELLSQIQQDPMRVVTRRVTVPITRQANLAVHHIPRLFAKLPFLHRGIKLPPPP